MIIEFLKMGGYGFYVWLSFLIVFTFCSLLFYKTRKTLKKYEKDHILFKATIEESKRDLIELDRVENYIKKIKNKIFINDLDRPSPLSIPLILEINHEVLNKTTVDNYYLNKLEEELLAEVGLE